MTSRTCNCWRPYSGAVRLYYASQVLRSAERRKQQAITLSEESPQAPGMGLWLAIPHCMNTIWDRYQKPAVYRGKWSWLDTPDRKCCVMITGLAWLPMSRPCSAINEDNYCHKGYTTWGCIDLVCWDRRNEALRLYLCRQDNEVRKLGTHVRNRLLVQRSRTSMELLLNKVSLE